MTGVFTLPEVLVLHHTATSTGDLVLLGTDTLVWVGVDGVRTIALGEAHRDTRLSHPSLLAHPAGGVVVLRNREYAEYFADPDSVLPLAIEGAELLTSVDPAPVFCGGSAVSDEPRWHVVLCDGVFVSDLHFAAVLTVDIGSGAARWESAPWSLDPTEFPGEDDNPWVSISATLLREGTVYACSGGSRLSSVTKWGADFFSCVRLLPDGHVGHRLYEQSGWRADPKKNGINAQFTVDGAYAVLTPVFRTGEWKGRARVLRLAGGELLTPRLPRGFGKAQVLDHHPDRGWWIRLDATVTAVPTLFA